MNKVLDIDGDFYEGLNTIMKIRKQSMSDDSLLKKERDISNRQSKKEVASHYDIGNDFYELWLDETMN